MSTPAELRQQIEHTRRELGDTVEELAAKADLKARAQERAAHAAEVGRRNAGTLSAAGGAVLTVIVAALLLRRRYHH